MKTTASFSLVFFTPILGAVVLAISPRAMALDTVEAFDPGAADVELFVGLDGIGRSEQQFLGNVVAGLGVIERFSVCVGTELRINKNFDQRASGIGFGLFGTILETDHVDFDLSLALSVGGENFLGLQLAPALELNIDLVPDLGLWGLFVQIGAPISGVNLQKQEGGSQGITVDIEMSFGTYMTLQERHQLLLASSMVLHTAVSSGEPIFELGNLALGYNIVLDDNIELITELRFGFPQEDDGVSIGLLVGLIATVPPSQRATRNSITRSPEPL